MIMAEQKYTYCDGVRKEHFTATADSDEELDLYLERCLRYGWVVLQRGAVAESQKRYAIMER